MSDDRPDTVRTRRGGRSARVRDIVLRSARQMIAQGGYDELSHRRVALEADVDRSTVYRRWPTRAALAVDALLTTTSPPAVPETGSLEGDLRALIEILTARLDHVEVRRTMLTHALALQQDPALLELGRRFWEEQLVEWSVIVLRAKQRGEINARCEEQMLIERLIAPIVLRALITAMPVDAALREQTLRDALRLAAEASR